MYLSCLNHVNELPNASTANRPPFMYFYIIHEYASIINIEFAISIMSTPTKWIVDNPKLLFFVSRYNVSMPHPLIVFILHKIIFSVRNHYY